QVFRYHRTPLSAVDRPVARFFDERLVNQTLFEVALRLAGHYPAITPHVNAAVVRAYFRPGRRVARSDRCFNLAMPPIHRETEVAVDLGDASTLLGEVDEAIRREGIRVNFPCE